MKKFLKILLRIVTVLAILVGVFILFIELCYDKKFKDTPYPTGIKASTDSTIIARGKYLVYGPAHCASCHTDKGQEAMVDQGQEVPLAGGFEIHLPLCVLRPRNITPDKETGIGNLTDAEIARTLRYNVNSKGEALIPVMPFKDMSDEDMIAVISYLRAQNPVKHLVKPTEYNLLGKAIKYFLIKPDGAKDTPPHMVTRDSSAIYGKYLATSVSNCYGCHTERDLKTGAFIGQPFAGGFIFEPSEETQGWEFVSPNLTPDNETGKITSWDQTAFCRRIKNGRVFKYSPMPWGPFSRMDETDMKAIHNFLITIKAVTNKIEKTAYQPGEDMPRPKS